MEKVDHILELQHLRYEYQKVKVIFGYIVGLKLVLATKQAAIWSPDRV